MSRVDDDREAARAAARLAEQKRAEEGKKASAGAQRSAFSSKVAQQQQGQVTRQESSARSAIASLKQQAGGASAREGQGRQDAAASGRLAGAKQGAQLKEQQQVASGRAAEAQDQGAAVVGRKAEAEGQARGLTGRRVEGRAEAERLEERGEAPAGAPTSGAAGEPKELKVDADRGGRQRGGSGGEQRDGSGQPPGFRFNPALMAPVPVAQAREATGSDRLRKVANELAQKIVERVRIGTNQTGAVEFQVDLRSDVLAGLSVKVTARQGRISAVFSGSDKEVLELIERHGETLKAALAGRGLTLEQLKTEARP